jgi:hypothetical protein
MSSIKSKAAERKATPVYSGVLRYFPDAIRMLARVSQIGNDQHNPGQPLHWARGKSTDHLDCLMRHLLDDIENPMDDDGGEHLAKVIWRAMAELQLRLEARKKDSENEPK